MILVVLVKIGLSPYYLCKDNKKTKDERRKTREFFEKKQ